MWGATVADIFRMAPREHLSVLAQDARYALRMMRRNLGYTVGRGADPRARHRRQYVDLQRRVLRAAEAAALSRKATTWWSCGSPRAEAGHRQYRLLRRRRWTTTAQQNRSLSGLVEYHTMIFTLFGAQRSASRAHGRGLGGVLRPLRREAAARPHLRRRRRAARRASRCWC